jgi:hypothetical protein
MIRYSYRHSFDIGGDSYRPIHPLFRILKNFPIRFSKYLLRTTLLDPESTTQSNPYAPSAESAIPVHPGAGGISLTAGPIRFAGAVTTSEIGSALVKPSRHLTLLLLVIMTLASLLLFFVALQQPRIPGPMGQPSPRVGLGGRAPEMWLFAGLALGAVMFGWAARMQSASHLAKVAARHSPSLMEPRQGMVCSDRIEYESQNGRVLLLWEAIVGVRIKPELIALSLNPQRLAVIVLPRRFFSAADWQQLVAALLPLADQLPFFGRPRNPAAIAASLTERDPLALLPCESTNGDATRVHGQGVVYLHDVLKTGYRQELLIKHLWAGCIVLALTLVLGTLLFAMSGGSFSERPLWLAVGLLPLLYLLRLGRLLHFLFWGPNQGLVHERFAVSPSGLWLSTPRGSSFLQWSHFRDYLQGEGVLLLRETPQSHALVPLTINQLRSKGHTREGNDDLASEWAQLVQIVENGMQRDSY